MTAHIQDNGHSQRTVKYDACNAVGIKKCFFRVMASQTVDDIEHHSHQNDSHAHGDRHDKYRIQVSYKRKICHGSLRTQPQRLDDILKTEYAAEEEAKYRGKEAAAGNNGCQVHLLCPV